jgi:hypothetical protein
MQHFEFSLREIPLRYDATIESFICDAGPMMQLLNWYYPKLYDDLCEYDKSMSSLPVEPLPKDVIEIPEESEPIKEVSTQETTQSEVNEEIKCIPKRRQSLLSSIHKGIKRLFEVCTPVKNKKVKL